MDSSKNERWIIPFKNFSRLRVNMGTLNAEIKEDRSMFFVGECYVR